MMFERALAVAAAIMLMAGAPPPAEHQTMLLCTGQGLRLVDVPGQGGRPDRSNCDKACHANCERRHGRS